MKRLAGLSALALIISTTSGCSWLWGDEGYFRNRGNDYQEARQTAPMQIPGDLQARHLDPLLPVPGHVQTPPVNEDFQVPRPHQLATVSQGSAFSIQRGDGSSWIVAQRQPAEVWPMAYQFFERNGLSIDEERPQIGEFVTGWTRADQLSQPLLQRLRSSGLTDDSELRARVRIEPGVQRNTSEVFVETTARPAGSRVNIAFTDQRSNASLQSVLLDELQTAMSSQESGSVSLLAGGASYDTPNRMELVEDGNGNPVLTLHTGFDQAWSAVNRALTQGNAQVDDMNRSIGVFFINGAVQKQEEPGFFGRLFGGGKKARDDKDAAAEQGYQVRLSTFGQTVQVTVEKDLNTVAPKDEARRILELIQANLG